VKLEPPKGTQISTGPLQKGGDELKRRTIFDLLSNRINCAWMDPNPSAGQGVTPPAPEGRGKWQRLIGLLSLVKSIFRWKAEKHNKQTLGKQKKVVILWAIENLEPGPLCSCELNCGNPGFEKLQSLVGLGNCWSFLGGRSGKYLNWFFLWKSKCFKLLNLKLFVLCQLSFDRWLIPFLKFSVW